MKKKQIDDVLQKSLNYLRVNYNNNDQKKEKDSKEKALHNDEEEAGDGKNLNSSFKIEKAKKVSDSGAVLSTQNTFKEDSILSIKTLKNLAPLNLSSSTNTFFNLVKNKFPFNPVKIKVGVGLLYGSYEIEYLESKQSEIAPELALNTVFSFDKDRCLLSSLPKETRISIHLIALSGSKHFVLGSAQVPLYTPQGFLQSGDVKVKIWPNFIMTPGINSCYDFNFNFNKYNEYFRVEANDISSDEKKLYSIIEKNKSNEQYNFDKIYVRRKGKKTMSLHLNRKLVESGLISENNDEEDKKNTIYKNNSKITFPNLNQPVNMELGEGENLMDNEDIFCEITIRFPKFSKPISHHIKSPVEYLDEKMKSNPSTNGTIDSSNLIESIYYTSFVDSKTLIKSISDPNSKPHLNILNLDSEKENIYSYLQVALRKIVQLLKKDPFSPLTKEERETIILCRDYISSIPSALVLFLRSIDWLNPLQTQLAHIYLKKWVPIEAEDAISLLDSKFPDTKVREYAINTLRPLSDDVISLYMLQMSQCLIYETYLISPLSDLILERSFKNPKLIGNSFFWNARVGMNNPLFTERLTVLLCQMLMSSGPNFLDEMFKKLTIKFKFQAISRKAKIAYANEPRNAKASAKESVKNSLEELAHEKLLPFSLPIDPSYFAKAFDSQKTNVFDSKMVPIKIACISSDGSILNVMFKIGDDLRQDLLTLQIMKIMDKLWIDNDLDLKIFPYKILPTELKSGFIEFVNGEVLDGLQKKEGFGGALDRELLIKYLRSVIVNVSTGEVYETEKQYDNFIRSLAGYCVATCVLGVADRHPGNVMIKSNGVFFHIDFGHILGNFKFKFGIKRERAPFLLTPEMSHVYVKTNNEKQFKYYCTKAFNILRHNATRLLNLIIIMSSAGMPEVCCMHDVKYLRDMLRLDLPSDEDATKYFLGLIDQSKNEKFRLLDNIIHNIKHG